MTARRVAVARGRGRTGHRRGAGRPPARVAPGVVVDSPPGAGKSTLVVRAAGRAGRGRRPVMVVAQTNEQVDDLVDRLARRRRRTLPIGRLSAADYVPSTRVAQHPTVRVAQRRSATCARRAVIVGTAAKWAYVTDGTLAAGRSSTRRTRCGRTCCCAIAPRFERALFVGDPGQLDPFSTVETRAVDRAVLGPDAERGRGAAAAQPVELPVHRLPVSWRLPASAAPVVAEAFYPFTPFVSGTAPGERRLAFRDRGHRRRARSTRCWTTAAATGWALYELPRAAHAAHRRGGGRGVRGRWRVRLLERGRGRALPDRARSASR